MVTVRDEGSATDLLANSESEHRNQLIPDEPEYRRQSDGSEMLYGAWVYESCDRLVGCHDGADENGENHHQSCQVFDTSVAVRKPLIWRAAREQKRHAERDGRSGITEVVDRVSQQRDTVGKDYDQQLKRRSDEKPHEGPLDSPEAALIGNNGWIDSPM